MRKPIDGDLRERAAEALAIALDVPFDEAQRILDQMSNKINKEN